MAAGTTVGTISIRVKPDTTDFRKELREDLQQIENKYKAKPLEVKVRAVLDRSYLATQLFKLKKDLAAKKLTVTIDVDIDDHALNRLDDITRRVKGGFGSRRSGSSWLPSFGGGINPAGYAVILGGIALVAAPLLGLITTALLTLPGLISMVATPIAALALGFDGLKEAAKSIKDPFDNLKKTLSDDVQTKFTPFFESLAQTFPMLERSMPLVNTGLAKMADGLAATLNHPVNAQKIEETIGRIGEALGDASPGLNDFVSGFITLANTFSEKFPGIVDWFNGAGESFRKWTEHMSQGGLQTAFGELGDTLKIILETLGQLATEGMKFIQDPKKMDGFKESLDGILGSLEGIAALGHSLQVVWDVIAKFQDQSTTMGGAGDGFKLFPDWDPLGLFPNKDKAVMDIDEVKAALDGVNQSSVTVKEGLTGVFDNLTVPPAAEGGGVLDQLQNQLNAPGVNLQAPPVEPPDTSPAVTELEGYQSFVDEVTSEVGESLKQAFTADTLPAPDLEAFKAKWAELPGHITNVMNDVTSAVTNAGPGLHSAGFDVGVQIGNGMVAGINSQQGVVEGAARTLAANAAAAARAELQIKSPSRVFAEIGEFVAQGLGVGIGDGQQSATDAAKSLATGIQTAFLTNLGFGDSMAQVLAAGGVTDQIAEQEKLLEDQQDALDIEKLRAEIAEKKAVSDEEKERTKAISEALSLRQDELDLQKKQLELTKKEAGELSEVNKEYASLIGKAMGVPVGMVETATDSFFSDLGFSGSGIAPTLLNEGVKYVFNVNGVDEALAIQKREQNKQALQYT